MALGTHRHRRHASRSSGSGEIGRPTPLFFESVTMKQFRDPALPINACYQAILQSVTFVDAIGEFEPLPAVRIKINDYATFELADSLGIPSGVWLEADIAISPRMQLHLRRDGNRVRERTFMVVVVVVALISRRLERLNRSPSRRASGRAPRRCGRPSAGRPGPQPRRAPKGGVAGPRRIAASVRAASRR